MMPKGVVTEKMVESKMIFDLGKFAFMIVAA